MESSCIEGFISTLLKHACLPEKAIKSLCASAIDVLSCEPNMVIVHAPVTICGDIHGQYTDLLEIFRIGGHIPNTNYLFLGDYVNRGRHSVEVITLLLCYKVRYSSRVTLLRGNHDSRNMTMAYEFYDECKLKYGNTNVWEYICEAFNYLPICAVIGGKIFGVHAGLSPSIDCLDQVNLIDRVQDIPHKGPITDFVWVDPDERNGWGLTRSYSFGADITKEFLDRNKLSLIVRSHQLAMNGYQWMHNNRLITMFSAPNYCSRCENAAAIIEVNEYLDLKPIVFTQIAPTESHSYNFPDYFN